MLARCPVRRQSPAAGAMKSGKESESSADCSGFGWRGPWHLGTFTKEAYEPFSGQLPWPVEDEQGSHAKMQVKAQGADCGLKKI